MTMNGIPSFSPTSKIVTTLGWDREAAVRASRVKRVEVVVRRIAVGEHLDGHDAAQDRVGSTVDVGHAPMGNE